jgi:hypothetical protein
MHDDGVIRVGDRVVSLSMPGIFRVVARTGQLLAIETDDGIRMTVTDGNVRRVDDTAA